jgi:phosphoglucomutase
VDSGIDKGKRRKENYVVGGEESYGLMIGDKVRDKDAISAVALLCEMAAYEKIKEEVCMIS